MKRKKLLLISAGLAVAYLALIYFLNIIKTEQIVATFLMWLLCNGTPTAKKIFRFVLPLFLTGVVYDLSRLIPHRFKAEVKVSWPYLTEKNWFGISTAQGVLTPNEFLVTYQNIFLDLYCGAAYLVFIPLFVGICAYFRFFCKNERAKCLVDASMWGFFWTNVLGYLTYLWFPAAPPWYVALHGLGPAILDTLPNPAGALRFDQHLGIYLFQGFYSKSADVFGAIPSLHVAYPFLAVIYSFYVRRLRGLAVGFYLSVAFAAIYLNHHYVIDVLWGTVYALWVGAVVIYGVEKKTATKEPLQQKMQKLNSRFRRLLG